MIKDFGENPSKKNSKKIEGNLCCGDLKDLTDQEKETIVRRDNIWPKPKMKKELKEKELPRFVIYWKNEIHKQIYPTPRKGISFEDYIKGVQKIKDLVSEVKTEADIQTFYETAKSGVVLAGKGNYNYSIVCPFSGVLNVNAFENLSKKSILSDLHRKMDALGFGLTEEEAADVHYKTVFVDGVEYYPQKDYDEICVYHRMEGSLFCYYFDKKTPHNKPEEIHHKYILIKGHNIIFMSDSETECRKTGLALYREEKKAISNEKKVQKEKKNWIPPEIELIRVGPDIPNESVIKNDFVSDYGFRGYDIGENESIAKIQQSQKFAYDAFWDLTDILKISPKDISLPGLNINSLAITFGREMFSYYNPSLEVIHLSILKNAGNLAYVWCHCLDDFIAKKTGIKKRFASENHLEKGIPESMKNLMETILNTDYYNNSKLYDKYYSKVIYGQWSSNCELFARAFSCYILDKLTETNRVNTYLCGHSHTNHISHDDKIIRAYPEGDEREKINHCFDLLFDELCAKGLLHPKF